MPSFPGEKNQNDPIRTEGGIVFQRNLEFVNSWISGGISALLQGEQYMARFSGKTR